MVAAAYSGPWAAPDCGRLIASPAVRHRACTATQSARAGSRRRGRSPLRPTSMSKLLRGLAAGYGAKKLGGGCFSTVLIFILLWWLLGNFGLFR